MKIIGAGLAGLIAGVLNQNATIYEPMDSVRLHRAVLRFRSPDIGEAVGIPFNKVTVYKGIWSYNQFIQLNPRVISWYSQKVSGMISHRSITNVSPEERWLAPDDFQSQLLDMCENRIVYGQVPDLFDKTVKISTMPITALANKLGYNMEVSNHLSVPIYVKRFKVLNCDAYMTVYYPDPNCNVYRASLSGDNLIIESISNVSEYDIDEVLTSFGIERNQFYEEEPEVKQNNGKMIPICEKTRRDFISRATLEYNIYSLGRLALWKSIILDEVYKDLLKIKTMINKDRYEHMRSYI